jgi:hypothetical protein
MKDIKKVLENTSNSFSPPIPNVLRHKEILEIKWDTQNFILSIKTSPHSQMIKINGKSPYFFSLKYKGKDLSMVMDWFFRLSKILSKLHKKTFINPKDIHIICKCGNDLGKVQNNKGYICKDCTQLWILSDNAETEAKKYQDKLKKNQIIKLNVLDWLK